VSLPVPAPCKTPTLFVYLRYGTLNRILSSTPEVLNEIATIWITPSTVDMRTSRV
jgi:hypothetical protein